MKAWKSTSTSSTDESPGASSTDESPGASSTDESPSDQGPGLLEVGRVAKAHGIKGQVVVDLVTNRPDRRLVPGATFATDGGDLTLVASSPHHHRWIVTFEGVGDRNAADALRGTVLRAAPIDEDGVFWVHELIGATVVDPDGASVGVVEEVQANPASDLLVLDGDRLVPMTFVVEHRRDDHVIVVDPPDGLL